MTPDEMLAREAIRYTIELYNRNADTADATTYVCVTSELGFDHFGRYDDQFVRSGNRWLIGKRHAAMEWSRPESRFAKWLGEAQPQKEWPW